MDAGEKGRQMFAFNDAATMAAELQAVSEELAKTSAKVENVELALGNGGVYLGMTDQDQLRGQLDVLQMKEEQLRKKELLIMGAMASTSPAAAAVAAAAAAAAPAPAPATAAASNEMPSAGGLRDRNHGEGHQTLHGPRPVSIALSPQELLAQELQATNVNSNPMVSNGAGGARGSAPILPSPSAHQAARTSADQDTSACEGIMRGRESVREHRQHHVAHQEERHLHEVRRDVPVIADGETTAGVDMTRGVTSAASDKAQGLEAESGLGRHVDADAAGVAGEGEVSASSSGGTVVAGGETQTVTHIVGPQCEGSDSVASVPAMALIGHATVMVAERTSEGAKGSKRARDEPATAEAYYRKKPRRVSHCGYPGCTTARTFGREGDEKASFCSVHKEEGMVNIKGRRCNAEGCQHRPGFAIPGDRRGKYCSTHRKPGMIDVVSRKCHVEGGGCRRQPVYGWPGEKPTRCGTHKLERTITNLATGTAIVEKMHDVRGKRCAFEGCLRQPGFGNPAWDKGSVMCNEHKLPGMTNVRKRRAMERMAKEGAPTTGLSVGNRPQAETRHPQRRLRLSRAFGGSGNTYSALTFTEPPAQTTSASLPTQELIHEPSAGSAIAPYDAFTLFSVEASGSSGLETSIVAGMPTSCTTEAEQLVATVGTVTVTTDTPAVGAAPHVRLEAEQRSLPLPPKPPSPAAAPQDSQGQARDTPDEDEPQRPQQHHHLPSLEVVPPHEYVMEAIQAKATYSEPGVPTLPHVGIDTCGRATDKSLVATTVEDQN